MKKRIIGYFILLIFLIIAYFFVKRFFSRKSKILNYIKKQKDERIKRIENINKRIKELDGQKKNPDDYKNTSVNDDLNAIDKMLRTLNRKR